MYDGPIIDPHHHLWDLSMSKHHWLAPGDGAVQALGGLDRLRSSYLPADYVADTNRHGVVASVHIEALWDSADPVGETRWLESLDKSRGVASRYVAAAPLGTDGAREIIRTQASFDRVVAIRSILSHHPDASKSFASRPDIVYDEDWRRDVAELRALGLHLELMAYPYQAEGVADLARSFPDLQIVVNHCASPIDRDTDGLQRWRHGLDLMAASENVALKISNPGAYDPNWTYQSVEAIVLACINAFGTDRCMFGTDYPVARLQMDIDDIYANFRRATSGFHVAEQRALFHDNAMRVYRL